MLAEIAKRPGTSAAVYTGIEAGSADQLTQALRSRLAMILTRQRAHCVQASVPLGVVPPAVALLRAVRF